MSIKGIPPRELKNEVPEHVPAPAKEPWYIELIINLVALMYRIKIAILGK